jgi:hypothetical protein
MFVFPMTPAGWRPPFFLLPPKIYLFPSASFLFQKKKKKRIELNGDFVDRNTSKSSGTVEIQSETHTSRKEVDLATSSHARSGINFNIHAQK